MHGLNGGELFVICAWFELQIKLRINSIGVGIWDVVFQNAK